MFYSGALRPTCAYLEGAFISPLGQSADFRTRLLACLLPKGMQTLLQAPAAGKRAWLLWGSLAQAEDND